MKYPSLSPTAALVLASTLLTTGCTLQERDRGAVVNPPQVGTQTPYPSSVPQRIPTAAEQERIQRASLQQELQRREEVDQRTYASTC